jgi:Ca-activated chloride channel family protein
MSSRIRRVVILLVLLALAVLALFLARCSRQPANSKPLTGAQPVTNPAPAATPAPAQPLPEERLSPATLQAPQSVVAGATFQVTWTGPDNRGDYVTIVVPASAAAEYDNYTETNHGRTLDLSAPIEPGNYELRYVTAHSKTVLGRAPLSVVAATASLAAPEEAVLGTTISVQWTGPNNPHDFVTVVAKTTPDGEYGNYTNTADGTPLALTLPPDAGDAELRYMTGQGRKVLARRAIKILTPLVSLEAPGEVIAGAVFKVSWQGPNNTSDYITVVPADLPDGEYKNYTATSKGSPLPITALITPGDAELRYMTGSGSRVLARRPIRIVAAKISLDAPHQTAPGASVEIRWTGPNNAGDYITIVPANLPDGQYRRYADTSRGAPAKVEAPREAGPAEIRYVSGQGARVLARRAIEIFESAAH